MARVVDTLALGGVWRVIGRVEDVGPNPITARPLDCGADLRAEVGIFGHEHQRLAVRADLQARQLLAQSVDRRGWRPGGVAQGEMVDRKYGFGE
jgi:hypothetical protein